MKSTRLLKSIIGIMIMTQGHALPVQNQSTKNFAVPVASGKVDSDHQEIPSSSTGKRVAGDREAIVWQVRDWAEQLAKFHDCERRAAGLARLGELLWTDDQSYARQALTRAFTLSDAADDDCRNSKAIFQIHQQILRIIEQKDPALADSLSPGRRKSTPEGPDPATFRKAYQTIRDDPAQATRMVKEGMPSGIFRAMPFFLLELREKSPGLADTLFLETLQQLPVQPDLDPSFLLELGNYLFTASQMQPGTPKRSIAMKNVGRILMPDISALRPGASSEAIVAYLETAAAILCRPTAAPDRAAQQYAAAYLILQKANTFAPHLSPLLNEAIQAMLPAVPAEMKVAGAFRNFDEVPPAAFVDILAKIDHEPVQQLRDSALLALAADLIRQEDFRKAREITGKFSDAEVRSRMNDIIDFTSIARSLEKRGPTADLERLCSALPPSLKRAILWLALAQAHLKKREELRARAALDACLLDAFRLHDRRVPYLLLSAAAQFASFDSETAAVVLGQAVREFDQKRPEPFGEGTNWSERIDGGQLWRSFSLIPGSLRVDLRSSVRILAGTNARTELIPILTGLGREDLRAEMYPVLAETLLANK